MRESLIVIAILGSLSGKQLAAADSGMDTSAAVPPRCLLTIDSTPESAHVVLDGKRVGSTPATMDSLIAGVHILTLQHPDAESWLTEPIIDTVRIAEGEHKALRYDFRTRYLITSTPFGADVLVADSVVGTTPIVATPWLAQQTIVLRKPGYEPADVHLALNQWGVVSVPLKKLWQYDGNGESYFKDYDGAGPRSTRLYISGAATILSGVAAAYFKIKADDKYQQYLSTNNSTLLAQTRRLDTVASIAIVATQIGLGLFTYFIFTQ